MFCIAIINFFILSSCARQDVLENNQQSQSDFMKLISERPVPDLETLAERSSPDKDYIDQNIPTEAFYDILKLRDIGDSKAVPVLKKIMSENINSTRTLGFAAAQALFCIGTSQAHEVLSKYLLNDQYHAGLSINYTYHWEMDKKKRNTFIEQYHLKNLSKNMEIKLVIKKNKDGNGQQLNLTITLKNISQESYKIRDKKVYLAKMIYLQSKNGQFMQWQQPVKYGMPMPKWIELAPGENQQYHFNIAIKPKGTQKLPYFEKNDSSTIFLETTDMICGIEKGEFKVYAMVEEQPLSKESLEFWKFDNTWIGRAVSEPITVKIP